MRAGRNPKTEKKGDALENFPPNFSPFVRQSNSSLGPPLTVVI